MDAVACIGYSLYLPVRSVVRLECKPTNIFIENLSWDVYRYMHPRDKLFGVRVGLIFIGATQNA